MSKNIFALFTDTFDTNLDSVANQVPFEIRLRHVVASEFRLKSVECVADVDGGCFVDLSKSYECYMMVCLSCGDLKSRFEITYGIQSDAQWTNPTVPIQLQFYTEACVTGVGKNDSEEKLQDDQLGESNRHVVSERLLIDQSFNAIGSWRGSKVEFHSTVNSKPLQNTFQIALEHYGTLHICLSGDILRRAHAVLVEQEQQYTFAKQFHRPSDEITRARINNKAALLFCQRVLPFF